MVDTAGINEATAEQWNSLNKMSKLCPTQPIPKPSTNPPPMPKATDVQVGGDHYSKHNIQPIDYIIANEMNFCEGNVIKYITRYKDKGGRKDLEKAKHYIDLLIDDINAYELSERKYEEAMGIY